MLDSTGRTTKGRYTTGEVTGIAAASLAIAAIGVGMNVADTSPHLGQAPTEQVGAPTTGSTTTGATPSPAASPTESPSTAAADQPLVIHRVLKIDEPIAYGQWYWHEQGAPAAGPIVITVDLEARVISAFRDGYEIGTAAVLLGTQEKPTPTGVFPISQKDAHHVSNLYDAPMPYMMRLTNDGVTIHATTVQNGYASHGCIGVPKAFAKHLFDTAQLGDKVYITRGKHVGVGDSLT